MVIRPFFIYLAFLLYFCLSFCSFAPVNCKTNGRMRNVFYICICIALWFLSSCSSNKKKAEADIQILMKDSVVVGGPERMQVSDAKTTITFKGKEYHSQVIRRPDDNLPVVKNEEGETFIDNRITLRITSGGKTVVDKVFTKESFAGLVDATFLKHSILEGLVYDKNTSNGMVYAASICYPQSDLYIPMSITVSADGKISLAKEELLEDVYRELED